MSNRVLVTGAGGFIGSHVVQELIVKGYEVKALTHYNALGSYGWLDIVEQIGKLEIIVGDITDSDSLKSAIVGCEKIINLAALIPIPYSYKVPMSYLRTNVQGAVDLALIAKEERIRLIQISTSEVYGSAQYVPINEAHPINPQSPYAASKAAADNFLNSFYKSFNSDIVICRPFNTFGPRQSLRAVIPTIIAQALQSKTIYLGETSTTRNFNYVTDTAKGIIEVMEKGQSGETYNLGQDFEISIKEVVDSITNILGSDIRIEIDANRERPKNSEVNRLSCDRSKLNRITSWIPEYQGYEGFQKALSETVEWFKSRSINETFRL